MRIKLKLRKTSLANLYSVPVDNGQLIVATDAAQMCYDFEGQRYTIGSRYVYTATGNQDDLKLTEFIQSIPGTSAEVDIVGEFSFSAGVGIDIYSDNLVSITLDWSNAKIKEIEFNQPDLFRTQIDKVTIKNLAIQVASNTIIVNSDGSITTDFIGCNFKLSNSAKIGDIIGSMKSCIVEASDYLERVYLLDTSERLYVEDCEFRLGPNICLFSSDLLDTNLIFTGNNVNFRNSESGVDYPLIETVNTATIMSNNTFLGLNIGQDVVINTNSSENVSYTNNIFRKCGVMLEDEFIQDYLVNIHIA